MKDDKPTKYEIEIAMKVCDYFDYQKDEYLQFELDKMSEESFDNSHTAIIKFPDENVASSFANFLNNTLEDTLYEVGDCFDLEGVTVDIECDSCNIVVS